MLTSVQLHTRLSSKIAFVGHSNSPVKAVTTALPSPDRAKNKQKNPQKTKETVSLYSFNYKPFKSAD